MKIKSINLSYFRNFNLVKEDLGSELTLVVGKNAKGKTSLLEAIYAILAGTGFRESKELELINFDKNEAVISAFFKDSDDDILMQIHLGKTEKERVVKRFFINKTQKPQKKFKDTTPQGVLFAPEHIQIITGSPSRKRRYFDDVLSKDDQNYKRRLRNYEEALRKRNKILENYIDLYKLKAEIDFWDKYLIEQAEYILSRRQKYIDFLNTENTLESKIFNVKYIKNMFSLEELNQNRDREYFLRRTLIGPQKDDYIILMNKNERAQEVNLFGSRSEQRMALFWLKRNELLYFEKNSGMKPILLLDDIFSELDDENRELVMKVVATYQTVATTTEEEVKDLSLVPEVIIRL